MKQFLLVVMMCFAMNSFAQTEFGKKFKPIAPLNKKLVPKKVTPSESVKAPVIKAPDLLKKPEQTLPSFSKYEIGQTKSFSMEQTNEFVNPGDRVMEKMTKDLDKTLVREGLKEDSRYLVKIDVNYGDIRTKSKYFVIRFRDFGAIDGDLIKAVFNDVTIVESVMLENSYNEFKIYFKEGFNELKLVALNRGVLGGNTGEFQIYDAEGKFIISDFWENWDTGVKGKFVIIKE